MKLVILDRDGVINHDRDDFVRRAEQWVPLPGSLEAIGELCHAGWTVAVATNQSGIARGYLDMDELARMHDAIRGAVAAAGGRIAHIAICPHGPEDGCACRKPEPGMIDEIMSALDVPSSAERWLVGDSLRDLQAGAARGFRLALVMTGKGGATLRDNDGALPGNCLVVPDLRAFAEILLEGEPPNPIAPGHGTGSAA